jgi:RNA polymerase sigma-70 factor, ECF subfamily
MTSATIPCPPAASDEELLTRFAGGQRNALEELFRRYRLAAYRVAYRLLGHEADALDAVQEGFVKALSHLDSFRGRSSFKTWLLRVVTNAALDLGRQRGRREALKKDDRRNGTNGRTEPLVADSCADRLEQADLRRLIDEALATLSDAHRRTFILHADGGLSYREVAQEMGISVGTVMSRLYYARLKLRAQLDGRLPAGTGL